MQDLDRLKAWVARATDIGVVAINAETVGEDPMQAFLCGLALAVAPNEACYVPLAHRKAGNGDGGLFSEGFAPGQISEADALAALKPLLENPGVLKIGQNLKFEWQIFAVRGIEMRAHEDTMLMSYVLDAGRFGHGLEALAPRYFNHTAVGYNDVIGTGKAKVGFDCVPFEKAAPYVAEDADIALRLTQVLRPRMVAEHVTTVYETLERPLLPVLARMERRGISVDRQVLSRLSGEFAQRAAGLEAEVRELAGDPSFNPGSPKQLGDILFGKMGLPGGTKTKTGQWSTGARVLDELAELGHVLPQKILEWRQVTKLKSTYTDALPGYINPSTRRVHTNYALAATPTGRLSSSEPNLQNIPIRTEEGRKIRRAFVADAGDEARLRRLFADRTAAPRRDRQCRTAAQGIPRRPRHPCHDRVGNVRRAGEGDAGRDQAPGQGDQLRHHLRHLGLRARQPAGHRARGGRRLHQEIFRAVSRHPRLHGGNQGLRQAARLCDDAVRPQDATIPRSSTRTPRSARSTSAPSINARLQGSAADIIRRAMVRMDAALVKRKLNAQMLLQVHDELVFEVPEDEVEKTLAGRSRR